jgi:hypothetical protein
MQPSGLIPFTGWLLIIRDDDNFAVFEWRKQKQVIFIDLVEDLQAQQLISERTPSGCVVRQTWNGLELLSFNAPGGI